MQQVVSIRPIYDVAEFLSWINYWWQLPASRLSSFFPQMSYTLIVSQPAMYAIIIGMLLCCAIYVKSLEGCALGYLSNTTIFEWNFAINSIIHPFQTNNHTNQLKFIPAVSHLTLLYSLPPPSKISYLSGRQQTIFVDVDDNLTGANSADAQWLVLVSNENHNNWHPFCN